MFTIEHEFDATVITLIDDVAGPETEDITVRIEDEGVCIEQVDPETEILQEIRLSFDQLEDLRAALNLPEGSYQRRRAPGNRSDG